MKQCLLRYLKLLTKVIFLKHPVEKCLVAASMFTLLLYFSLHVSAQSEPVLRKKVEVDARHQPTIVITYEAVDFPLNRVQDIQMFENDNPITPTIQTNFRHQIAILFDVNNEYEESNARRLLGNVVAAFEQAYADHGSKFNAFASFSLILPEKSTPLTQTGFVDFQTFIDKTKLLLDENEGLRKDLPENGRGVKLSDETSDEALLAKNAIHLFDPSPNVQKSIILIGNGIGQYNSLGESSIENLVTSALQDVPNNIRVFTVPINTENVNVNNLTLIARIGHGAKYELSSLSSSWFNIQKVLSATWELTYTTTQTKPYSLTVSIGDEKIITDVNIFLPPTFTPTVTPQPQPTLIALCKNQSGLAQACSNDLIKSFASLLIPFLILIIVLPVIIFFVLSRQPTISIDYIEVSDKDLNSSVRGKGPSDGRHLHYLKRFRDILVDNTVISVKSGLGHLNSSLRTLPLYAQVLLPAVHKIISLSRNSHVVIKNWFEERELFTKPFDKQNRRVSIISIIATIGLVGGLLVRCLPPLPARSTPTPTAKPTISLPPTATAFVPTVTATPPPTSTATPIYTSTPILTLTPSSSTPTASSQSAICSGKRGDLPAWRELYLTIDRSNQTFVISGTANATGFDRNEITYCVSNGQTNCNNDDNVATPVNFQGSNSPTIGRLLARFNLPESFGYWIRFRVRSVDNTANYAECFAWVGP